MPENQPKFITTKNLAERWGISPQSLANQRSLGTSPVPYLRLNGSIRYSLADVEAVEAAARVEAVA